MCVMPEQDGVWHACDGCAGWGVARV